MKGGVNNQPTLQDHLERHAALILEAGRGAQLEKGLVDAYLMEASGVGLIESVDRHLRAWEGLGLIEWHRGKRGAPGWVRLLDPRPSLRLPPIAALLGSGELALPSTPATPAPMPA